MKQYIINTLKYVGLFYVAKCCYSLVRPNAKKGTKVFRAPSFISVRRADREIRINPSHEVYLFDMIKYFDYYHNAVFPNECNGIFLADYSSPKLHKLKRSGVEFEFPSLPESDQSTEAYLAALNLCGGDIVFDLGAYAGASAYFLSGLVGSSGKVLCFEPDDENFRYLKANVERHSLENVQLFKLGIWNEATSLAFQSEGNMGSSAVSIVGRNTNTKLVEVVTLNDVLSIAGIENCRVAAIKMDIEGAELSVLKHAGEFLRKHQPRLIIEPHCVDGKMCTEELCSLLDSYGYSTKLIGQGVEDWHLIAAWPNSRNL